MKRSKVLMVVLVLSLIGNAYLLATRPSTPSVARSQSPAGPRRGELPAISRGLPQRPEPGTARNGASGSSDDEDAPADDREGKLAAELLKSQAELEKNLPLSDRFKRVADRTPEVEDQIKPVLDGIFPARADGKAVYSVECHGSVCALKVDDDQDTDKWMQAIQSSPTDAFHGFMFGGLGTFLEVNSAEQAAGVRYAQSVFAAITASPIIAECKQRFPTPGKVLLRVEIDPVHQARVAMEGPLADKSFGACLRPLLDRAPSEVPPPPVNVPAGALDAVQYVQVPLAAPAAPPAERKAAEHLATTATLPQAADPTRR